ncbi:MAG: DNA primase [Bacteroides sp.]|nr:DNA primase [Bacteroides sp.]
MKKIDNATVQRILDAADIVEVVSDFVALKKRGANYVGLCPFHNDRSPSFYVSKAKGLCKCFSCGEGGSPVSFIMKLEQLSFTEALRYLAKKYNIEIEEREMTDDERRAESDRENMLALNDFAMRYFEKNLHDTPDGRDIGLSYFRYRGISDAMIEKFHLGYALDGRDALYTEAIARGYSERYLLSTGLCSKTDDGRIYDRFRGRVIYPIFTISGKVVAFGGRTLSKEKKIAKYVNSPESDIYLKRRELYGLFQAKQAIAKAQKCILVEGYMDVISMHQAGVCNVVASSGTALTVEQVRLIKRFTSNVTLIYDSDAAGIKASLRGIELLLQDGMDIKVLLLPEGDDPDSFAQNHSSTEVEEYIRANETDFISFMAKILMEGAANDPTRRAQVITRVVKTIALIPDEITRSVYVQDCSRILFMDEDVLRREVGRYYNEFRLKSREEQQRAESLTTLPDETGPSAEKPGEEVPADAAGTQATGIDSRHVRFLRTYEMAIARLIAKYGNYAFAEGIDDDGNAVPMTVLEYIESDLMADEISFVNPDIAHFYDEALRLSRSNWDADYSRKCEELAARRSEEFAAGVEEIRQKATDTGSISAMEHTLQETVDANYANGLADFSSSYLARQMCSSPDDIIRNLASDLVVERHILSKMHTKYAKVPTEQEMLAELVPRTLHELKDAILCTRQEDIRGQLAASAADYNRALDLMRQIKEIEQTRSELAKLIGDRVIAPRK